MSNIHEYVLFDRAELDRVLAMNWQQLEEIVSEWMDWDSAREFLVERALELEDAEKVDQILERKTVRQTFRFCDNFYLLRDLLEITDLGYYTEIPNGNDEFGKEIFSCAAGAYDRGELSLPSLAAVYNLHLGWVDLNEFAELTDALLRRPAQKKMLPRLPDALPNAGNGLNVSDTRRFMAFLLRAWNEKWPNIRSSEVANQLYYNLRTCDFSKPCIFHWFEC